MIAKYSKPKGQIRSLGSSLQMEVFPPVRRRVQFIGSYADYAWSQLWKAKVENKCKFHLWILL
jgi:hypothetical protein